MKTVSDKMKLRIIYSVNLILLIILAAGLIPFSRKNSPKAIDTALLNPGNISKIASITIKDGKTNERSVILQKKNGTLWTGYCPETNVSSLWPCDIRTVVNFVTRLGSVISATQLSDNPESLENWNLDPAGCISVSITGTDGKTLSHILFGKTDPLTNRIAFKTAESNTVWSTADDFSVYLSTDESFWCEPLILPRFMYPAIDSPEENSLRRGKLIFQIPDSSEVKNFTKTVSNGNRLVLTIYKDEDSYAVKPEFIPYDNNLKSDWASVNYMYKISSWTYDRLTGEFEALK